MPRPAFDPPPLALLRWTRRARSPGVPALPGPIGAEAYAAREDWLTARRSWEHGHGQAVGEWYAVASAEARAERGFDGFADMLAYLPDPDVDPAEGWNPLRDEW